MKVKDITNLIFDKVVLYQMELDNFKDLYNGCVSNIPIELLEKNIGSIGAKRKGILDIQVLQ